MKIALDPYMHRHLPLEALPRKAAEVGYEDIELSPRANRERFAETFDLEFRVVIALRERLALYSGA